MGGRRVLGAARCPPRHPQGGGPTREAAACTRLAIPGEAAPACRAPAHTSLRLTTRATWRAPVAAAADAGSWGHTTGDAYMQDDIRAEAAQYYDANPTIPDAIAFYTARLPAADAAVLNWGAGRVGSCSRSQPRAAVSTASIAPRPCLRAASRSCRSQGCLRPKPGRHSATSPILRW